MNTITELKKLEDKAQEIELWLFSHKKEVDAKRLEIYELLRSVAAIKEKEENEHYSKGGRGQKEGKTKVTNERPHVCPRKPEDDIYE